MQSFGDPPSIARWAGLLRTVITIPVLGKGDRLVSKSEIYHVEAKWFFNRSPLLRKALAALRGRQCTIVQYVQFLHIGVIDRAEGHVVNLLVASCKTRHIARFLLRVELAAFARQREFEIDAHIKQYEQGNDRGNTNPD